MKTLLITSLFLAACAGTTAPPVPLNPAEKKEAEKASSDDYQDAIVLQASRDRIAEKLLREKRALEDCLTNGKSTPCECEKMRHGFCEISTMVDSMGSYVLKPYCH